MGILLFNWLGYQLLYSYLLQQSDKHFEARLDKNEFDENDLLTIKVPLHLPYMTDQPEFQRIDGEINLNGIQYKYVKRRVYHDSLILLCLPDKEKTKLKEAKNNYFRLVTDLQHQNSDKTKDGHTLLKNLITDCILKQLNWTLCIITTSVHLNVLTKQNILSFQMIDKQERPPEYKYPFLLS
jgi:hypothetical protein